MIHKIHPTIFVLLLAACPKSNVDVGTITPDGGGTGGAGTGGTPAAHGGATGSGGSVIVGEVGKTTNVGAACDIGGPYQNNQAIFNWAAPECSSGICLRPALAPNLPATDTAPYCTAACSTDDDCAGLVRNPGDPNDRGCVSGFTCGIPFVKGALCCKKMCVCRDFTGGATDIPIACQNGAAETCNGESNPGTGGSDGTHGSGGTSGLDAPPSQGSGGSTVPPDVAGGGAGGITADGAAALDGAGGNDGPADLDASTAPPDIAGSSNLGAVCDLGFVAGASQGGFNSAASECSSGVCVKPAVAPGLDGVDTGPLCTAACLVDGDCAGTMRNPNDPNDKGCISGFTCAMPFVKGSLCCRRMCVCMDFTGGPMDIPIACQNGAGLSCN